MKNIKSKQTYGENGGHIQCRPCYDRPSLVVLLRWPDIPSLLFSPGWLVIIYTQNILVYSQCASCVICAGLCVCHMQPLLGFQSVNSYLLQCLFDNCCVLFFPLDVLVSIADCPVSPLVILVDYAIFIPFFILYVCIVFVCSFVLFFICHKKYNFLTF